MSEAKRNECTPPPPFWAVFITKAWGQKIDERQWSVPLPKAEAKECMSLLRRMEKQCPIGKRYRIRKLPSTKAHGRPTTGEGVMKKYTVLLLRPDYAAATYGHDTFCAHVEGKTFEDALAAARSAACEVDEQDYPEDYYCLFGTDGHVHTYA